MMYRYAVALLLVSSGCAGPTTPDGPPTLVGPIVARDARLSSVGGLPNIHVQPAGDGCGTVFAIDRRTTLRLWTATGRLHDATADDLTIGRTVRAWARGPILTSCPGQSVADAIELLE